MDILPDLGETSVYKKGAIIDTSTRKDMKSKASLYVTVLGFAVIYLTLLSFFRPELILSPTTTAGGDTGAHHYVADYLINHLLPHGKITGWSPGWYAGFPMLHFYFPFPFMIIALLNLFMQYEVAFKLGTILGLFLLPATTYGAFRVLGFRFPLPIMAAAFSLPFLFMESYSIYGANILSTLAGEFGYSLSFSLTILFFALLYRDVKEQRFRVSTGVLLGIITLSHLVTTIMIVIMSTYYLFRRLNLKRFGILAGVFGLGFVLSSFWGLPFLAKLDYTAHMQWDQLSGLNELIPEPLRLFFPLTVIGVAGALAKRDERVYFLLWSLVVSASLFFLLPPGRIWNGRLLPFFYFFSFVWAAYGLWFLRKVIAQLLYDYVLIPKRHSDYILGVLAAAIAAVAVFGVGNRVADDWIKWNYSGFEGKTQWASYNEINEYIKGLPPGRVMIEHANAIDKFGTPRAFELLPYFASHPTMEGTLMEASLTAPFHFVNQSELSKEPSHAILGVKYPPLNVADGIRHLKVYNIPYFLALSDEVKSEADNNPDLELLKRFKVKGTDMEFALYETETEGYVTIPEYKPLLTETPDWRQTALDWYAQPQLLETPLIELGHAKELKGKYKMVGAATDKMVSKRIDTDGRVSNVRIKDDELTFSTTAIGVPHWIKISYFPNWKATGADGPYLASPSLMMVIPKQKDVRLYYGSTFIDIFAAWFGAIGWFAVLAYALRFAWRRFAVPATSSMRLGDGLAGAELQGEAERSNI